MKPSLTKKEIEELRRDYDSGMPVEDICKVWQIAPSSLYLHVTPKRKFRVTKDAEEQIMSLRKQGLGYRMIAMKTAIPRTTVADVVKRLSVVAVAILCSGAAAPPKPFESSRGAYESITEACEGESARLSPPRFAGEVARWCHYRTKHSSRGNTIVSRVDGSQIHDRDRPAAHIFYRKLVRRGVLRPSECVYHEAPSEVHPHECRTMAARWPFRSPVMTPERREAWLGHHHGYERFSTRGPHDNTAYSYITMQKDGYSTCWPIWWLDDPGVAAEVTVRRALQRCAGFRKCTFEMIKEAW